MPFSGSVFGSFGSWIFVSLFKTSSTRSAETAALGSITEIIQIIRNDIIICIAYWINAIISPTCIAPSLILCPPTHTIRTVIPFITSIIVGIINVMARLTNKFNFVRSLLALSKRSSSCFSVWNARITGSPVRISRLTRFSLSTMFCTILNFGITTMKSTATTMTISSTARPMIQNISTFVLDTFKIPPIAITGAYNTIRRIMTVRN